ncbi:MAG TPA: 2-oxo-4-hydroxy-4-carboxy-5-ureidoimidazoline decarboxylase [Gemmatimonadaceae bacterium]|nr:2-oxo-4-hydroxy-4-carboxy-5-ureidoimidazoline decarboxylase [Gemmatimonadaceae bacterium]
MEVSVAELNAMSDANASKLLSDCCGASRWVAGMLARRPFGSRAVVLSTADEIWRSLDAGDWREAFSHHPRIGEQKSAAPQSERGSAWAAGEQSGVKRAHDDLLAELAAANREYEQRFGYTYIVFATGKSAEEMLALARERLRNDPEVEIRAAAEEQRKITRLRLNKLLGEVA